MPADALEGELLFVERVDFRHLEADRASGIQDRFPNAIVGVMEDHTGPPPRLEHPVHLAKRVGHQARVVRQGVALAMFEVNDGFLALIREAFVQPGFPDQVAVGVEDVGAEGWVSEDVVNRLRQKISKIRCRTHIGCNLTMGRRM